MHVTTAEAGGIHIDANGRYNRFVGFTPATGGAACSLAGMFNAAGSWRLGSSLRYPGQGCRLSPSAVDAAFMW